MVCSADGDSTGDSTHGEGITSTSVVCSADGDSTGDSHGEGMTPATVVCSANVDIYKGLERGAGDSTDWLASGGDAPAPTLPMIYWPSALRC